MMQVAALFILTLAIRAVFFFFQPFQDPSWSPHWNLSTGILKFGTLGYAGEQVTVIEPGYPFFLALARFLSGGHAPGAVFLQVLAASATVFFVYEIASRHFHDRRAAFWAGIFFAGYPYLIGQATQIVEVSLFTLCLAAAFFFYFTLDGTLRRALFCGTAFGAILLTRSMIFPALAFALAGLIFKKRIKEFFGIFFAVSLMIGPWLLRNHRVDGSWLPPRSGWNLIQGNCAYSDKIIPRYNPDILDAYVDQLLQEEKPEWTHLEGPSRGKIIDDYLSRKAFEFIRSNPWRVLKLKVRNVFYLFHPRIVPFESMDENTRIDFTGPESFTIENIPKRGRLKETAHAVSYGFILIAAGLGFFLRRAYWKQDLFFYGVIFNFTVVYAVYWPATRLRAPMDFILMLFAGYFMSQLFGRFKAAAPHGSS